MKHPGGRATIQEEQVHLVITGTANTVMMTTVIEDLYQAQVLEVRLSLQNHTDLVLRHLRTARHRHAIRQGRRVIWRQIVTDLVLQVVRILNGAGAVLRVRD